MSTAEHDVLRPGAGRDADAPSLPRGPGGARSDGRSGMGDGRGDGAGPPPGSSRPTGGRRIAPLYKRLPKGPHGIAPEDVVHHQRIRMHGAMIEAIAAHGYERTSVKHVIGLAGVSRRAFYEQFANKEDCFMETFDLIVNRAIRRVNGACRASDGSLEQRMSAGLRALVEELETNPKALHLVLLDALTAGPEGQLRLRRALGASEQLLAAASARLPRSTHCRARSGGRSSAACAARCSRACATDAWRAARR